MMTLLRIAGLAVLAYAFIVCVFVLFSLIP